MATLKETLEGQTVADLKAFAADHDIDLAGASTKAEIVDAIEGQTSATDVSDYWELEEPVEEEAATVHNPGDGDGDGAATAEAPASALPEDWTPGTAEPVGSGDPALTDPEETAKEGKEGSTSDPATRDADTPAADTPPDTSPTTAKPSDAGAEAYPFPTGGDVEVALVEPGDGDGEFPPAFNVDDWVVLDGDHELVPDSLDGHLAYIVDAPSVPVPGGTDFNHAARTPAPGAAITVRTRDQYNATLTLPEEAFKAVGRGGRSAVQSFA